jgi:hypothetical protein
MKRYTFIAILALTASGYSARYASAQAPCATAPTVVIDSAPGSGVLDRGASSGASTRAESSQHW